MSKKGEWGERKRGGGEKGREVKQTALIELIITCPPRKEVKHNMRWEGGKKRSKKKGGAPGVK